MVLPTSVEDAEVTGLFAASRVSVLEGHGLQHTEAWVALRPGEVLVFPTDPLKTKERLALSTDQRHSTLLPPPIRPSNKCFRTSRTEFKRRQTHKSLPRQEWSLCCAAIESQHVHSFFCVLLCKASGSV